MFKFLKLLKIRLFKFLKLEKWELVKSFKIPSYRCTYFIHLFESNRGSRRIECNLDGDDYDINSLDFIKRHDVYQLQIYRWLQGRMDPQIPRYDQISEDDTANYLKGSV